jgi:hypothetical protein
MRVLEISRHKSALAAFCLVTLALAACGVEKAGDVRVGQSPSDTTVPEPPPGELSTETSVPPPSPGDLTEEPAWLPEPFPDSGDPQEIAALKGGAVEALMNADMSVYAFPAPTEERDAYIATILSELQAGSPGIADALVQQLYDTWADFRHQQKKSEFRRSVQTASSTVDFSGYSEADLEIIEWTGVRVDGDAALATFTAHQLYHRTANRVSPQPSGWTSGPLEHYQVELVYEDGWRLADIAFKRVDGATGP